MAKRKTTSRRKLNQSLGESWDDATYSSGDGASTISDVQSDVELEPTDEKKSLLPQQSTISSAPHQQDPSPEQPLPKTATNNLRSSDIQRTPRPSKLSQSTSTSPHVEPSFIMPKLDSSVHSTSNGSPSRRSKTRSQNIRNRTPHLRTSDRSATAMGPSFTARRQSNIEPQPQQDPTIMHYVNLFYEHFVSPVTRYLFGVFGHAMGNLQPFLGLGLAGLILVFGVQWAFSSFRSGLTTALSPVCLIPGSSYVVPFCAAHPYSDDTRIDFEGLLDAQSGLEEILDASKDTSTLPATIKDSEIAIRDLRTLVRHSRLPSRYQLDLEFENFVLTAAEASMDLSRYNSRIGATIDRIIATNTWTMAVLSGISEQEASHGLIDHIYSTVTRPFTSPPPTLHQRIFDQYLLHVTKNKEEITSLIQTAVALLSVLQNLDDRLDTIYSIAINDDTTITHNQDELLSHLWTKLGGNTAKLKANNRHLTLLKGVAGYRQKALRHVSDTLLKLREIQAELEDLRESVSAPEVLGWRDEVPLSFHLELIEKGVERLRRARGDSLRVEGETYRRLVRGGDDVKELPGGGKTVTVGAK